MAGKPHGWRSAGGTLFKPVGPLLFVLVVGSGAREKGISYSLRVKWFAFDDLHWEILGMAANCKEPMSLRANGAFSISAQHILNSSLTGCEWTPQWIEKAISDIVVLAEGRIAELQGKILGLDEFMAFAEGLHQELLARSPKAVVNLWEERLLTHLMKGEVPAAAAVIEQRLAARDTGGIVSEGRTFYEHAERYVAKSV